MNQPVEPASEVHGQLILPADKSISHRSAMFAALHSGTSVITNFSRAADPHSTLNCLSQLGVPIEKTQDKVIIQGVGRDGFQAPEKDLDCGNSGTTMRLLSGIIAGAGVKARLVGDNSLSGRTMSRIIAPLQEMGAKVAAREGDFAPLTIDRTSKILPLHFALPIPSAQLKSCVLLAGLFGDEPTKVVETLPSRDHTERLLQLTSKEENDQKIISASREDKIPPQSYRIPNDFSAAAFWLVAGAIHPNASIILPRVGINPTRTGALDVLREMGADIVIDNRDAAGKEPIADLKVTTSSLNPVHITEDIVPNCIDELPILAVAMLFADGTSRISGAEELRHKETDRLTAMAELLNRCGASFTEKADGLVIHGSPDFQPKSATFRSFHDHRIAMSAAVLALLADGTSRIADAECTSISYPSFWEHLTDLTN